MTMGMDLVLFILPSFIALEMRLILLTVLLMKILLYQFTVSMLVSDVPLVCWNSNLIAAIYHKIKNQNLSPEPCTESEVRLNNEMVQICHNQQWTPVCSFSDSAAEVVCNQVEIPSRC